MTKTYKNNCPEGLRKAVREYYEWHGDKRSFAIRIFENKSDDQMVLARFVDKHGEKMSALMFFQGWADGHYDVSEYEACSRICEGILVKNFKASDWGPVDCEEDDDDDDDDDEDDLRGTPEDEYDYEQEVLARKHTFDGGYDDYEENMIL